jgi:hypothetical protein
MISREAQEGSINLNWLVVALLFLIFIVPAVSEEIAQEPQQADPNTPQKILRGYKVDTSRKDEEGNFIRTPVYEEVSSEVPPVELPPIQPPVISSTFRTKLQKESAYIGPEIYSFKYKEPGVMEDEGTFYGMHFGCTSRDWVSTSSLNGGSVFKAEGRFAFGQVDYDGALQNSETEEIIPYKLDGINDFVFEGRLLLGADMLSRDTLFTLYSGVGYRYLNDDPSFDQYFYERESNYLYIPLGGEIYANLKADWYWGARIEFDYLLWGMQRSHLSNVGYNDVDNRQKSGYGYRASVRFQHKSKGSVFAIEPFFRYWDINDSEIEYAGYGYYGLEPANETKEIGVQLFWIF